MVSSQRSRRQGPLIPRVQHPTRLDPVLPVMAAGHWWHCYCSQRRGSGLRGRRSPGILLSCSFACMGKINFPSRRSGLQEVLRLFVFARGPW